MSLDIPLKVVICDENNITGTALRDRLSQHPAVLSVDYADSIAAAQQRLRADEINTIFIDPPISIIINPLRRG